MSQRPQKLRMMFNFYQPHHLPQHKRKIDRPRMKIISYQKLRLDLPISQKEANIQLIPTSTSKQSFPFWLFNWLWENKIHFVKILFLVIALILFVDYVLILKPDQESNFKKHIFSHRCASNTYNKNYTDVCLKALRLWPGVEVDVLWDDVRSELVLAYEMKQDVNFTLLTEFVQVKFSGHIWFDLKFKETDCDKRFVDDTCTILFLDILRAGKIEFDKVLVESRNRDSLSLIRNFPLPTIAPKALSTYRLEYPSDYIVLWRTSSNIASGDMDGYCMKHTSSCLHIQYITWLPCLSDAFFYENGKLLYSSAPTPPSSCGRHYVGMSTWRVVIYATFVLLLIILLYAAVFLCGCGIKGCREVQRYYLHF